MKHREEIIRWANCPEGTKVWYRRGEGEWADASYPCFLPYVDYIVDDE